MRISDWSSECALPIYRRCAARPQDVQRNDDPRNQRADPRPAPHLRLAVEPDRQARPAGRRRAARRQQTARLQGMRMPMMRRFRAPLIAAIAAATLSGCIGLGGKTPPFLLTLDPEAEPQAGTARTAAEAATLTILIPTAPQKLRTTRKNGRATV